MHRKYFRYLLDVKTMYDDDNNIQYVVTRYSCKNELGEYEEWIVKQYNDYVFQKRFKVIF